MTGAGSGIGRATARQLAEEGATVAVTDVDADGGEETVATIEDDGNDAFFREVDVRNEDEVTDAVDDVAADHGLDVMVNNAGVAHPPDRVDDVATDMRDFVIETNALGAWNGTQAAVPHLEAGGGGAIVNIASVAGLRGLPSQAAYSLSKGGIVNFTRAVAIELGPAGIRANAVCPGLIRTPLTSGRFEDDGGGTDDPRAEDMSRIPLRRAGQPEDVAACIAFLASDEASYVTGHAFAVDGGITAST